jgi:hypothetical protein
MAPEQKPQGEPGGRVARALFRKLAEQDKVLKKVHESVIRLETKMERVEEDRRAGRAGRTSLIAALMGALTALAVALIKPLG